MASRLTYLMVAIMLLSLGALGAVELASSQETPAAECGQSVTHTGLMSSEAVAAFNESGEATSRLSNTVVTVEDAPAFVRLRVDNPNGYCVRFTVDVSPEIVPPADLGTVESNSGQLEASWRAVQNLSAGTVRTRVTFTVPANTNATFAPSTVRVRSLAWTGEVKKRGGSIFDSISDVFSDSALEKRRYTIEPTESSSAVTVPLEDAGRSVDDWLATYQLDGSRRAVSQDASAPVYYTESRSSVTFHFNDKDATVTFVADPTAVDRLRQSASSYTSGLRGLSDWLPFTLSPGVSA